MKFGDGGLRVADITVHGLLRNRNQKLVTSLAPVTDNEEEEEHKPSFHLQRCSPTLWWTEISTDNHAKQAVLPSPQLTHVILAALAIFNVLTGTGTSLYGSKAWIEKLDLSYELNGHRGCVNTLSYEIPIGNYRLIGGIDGVKKASISSREVMTIDCSSGPPTTSLLSEKYSTRVSISLL